MRRKKIIKPLKKLNIQYTPTIRETTSTGYYPNKITNQWEDDVDDQGDVKLKKIGSTDFN